MSKLVYIEGEYGWGSYCNMWQSMGYTPTKDLHFADVVQFTGGEDVDPYNYDSEKHPKTYSNYNRDLHCYEIFGFCCENNVPMAGICRGGQFLNVANGGSMFQHCDGHAIYGGTHKATIIETGLVVYVTSTHHQIMIPNYEDGIVLMKSEQLGTFKEFMSEDGRVLNNPQGEDVEAIYYPETNSLCFQPHCEYMPFNHPSSKTYRYFLRNYLGLRV